MVTVRFDKVVTVRSVGGGWLSTTNQRCWLKGGRKMAHGWWPVTGSRQEGGVSTESGGAGGDDGYGWWLKQTKQPKLAGCLGLVRVM